MKAKVNFSGSIGSNPVNIDSDVRTEIDWEQRRFELVKAVSQAAIHTEFRFQLTDDLCKRIITFADAILEEYRKEQK